MIGEPQPSFCLEGLMNDPVENAVRASTPHELIVTFLQRECGVKSDDYDALQARMIEWANGNPAKAAVNEFSPIMLLEQCRREFDDTVDFVTFALVAADLQWGPRMLKLGGWDNPVWVIALEGFPKMIEEAKRAVARQTNG